MMMHGVRWFSRFAHIDGSNAADPVVYVRLPKIEDYAETLRGHRVLHLVGKGSKPPPCR